MPGANESSTVEWQSAQVRPIDCMPPLGVAPTATTPTTAFSAEQRERVRRIVQIDAAAGERADQRPAAAVAASTFSPTPSAAAGLTPGPTPPKRAPSIAWCSLSVSPQKCSSPKVSKRNVWRPRLNWSSAASSIVSSNDRVVAWRTKRPCADR